MSKVLCLGDSCADIVIPYGDHLKNDHSFSCGGSNANSAAALGKLGVSVAFAGKAGNDIYGRTMKQELQDNSVDVSSFILDDELVSTQVVVTLDENNDRHPSLLPQERQAYLEIYPQDLSLIDLSDTEYILTNGMMLFEEPAAKSISDFLVSAHERGIRILLDINYRPETIHRDKYYLDTAIAAADYLLGSIEDDFLPLTGTKTLQNAVKTLLTENNAIIAHDKKGASAFTLNHCYSADSYPVEVSDTLGAGDAFNAGFIYGLIHNKDLQNCLAYGNAVASLCISHPGARNTPDENALRSFLESHRSGCSCE
ncbi:MAG: carbohydrate kinase family protein [Erysipelotrichaceae bacterium]|nr:carbohydrate kinase family protein [Erysipelotrichaceae bacterium]